MDLRKNMPLIIGLAIPVLMILFVAGSIYIPGFFTHAAYDFIYVQGDSNYYYDNRAYESFSVLNGKIAKNSISPPVDPNRPDLKPPSLVHPRLYYHHVKANRSTEITFEEAGKLMLDPNAVSPDGFEVVQGNGGGDFPFFFGNRDYNARYIRGRNVSRKLNLINVSGSNYYYNDFHFLGWIIPSPVSHE